ncbi:MAG: hypothetical protein AAB368_12075, partial [bacterium]
LLQSLSTGGFFLNAFEATEDASIDYIVALKGYLCAGNCVPVGDTTENQGALAFTSWTGRRAPVAAMRQALRRALREE